jgi:hypothetical protein
VRSRPIPENGTAHGLRPLAVGALSGALAGTLFGAAAILVQAALTQVTVASYGRTAAVDNAMTGDAFVASPNVLITFVLLGGICGLLFGAARARLKTPGVVTTLGFAVLLVLVLQPLLLGAHLDFSAVAWIGDRSAVPPGGYFKPVREQVLPPLVLRSILAALIFVEGLAIALAARLVGQLLPNLPAAAYAVITMALGIPGLAIFALLLFVATGAGGG